MVLHTDCQPAHKDRGECRHVGTPADMSADLSPWLDCRALDSKHLQRKPFGLKSAQEAWELVVCELPERRKLNYIEMLLDERRERLNVLAETAEDFLTCQRSLLLAIRELQSLLPARKKGNPKC